MDWKHGVKLLGITAFLAVAVVFASAMTTRRQQAPAPDALGIDTATLPARAPATDPELHPVHVHRPTGPPVVTLDGFDVPVVISCSTCHSVRDANPVNRTPADLDLFHQDMVFAHGEVACLACHNPDDADTLRLADGTAVEHPDVMTLCAQCHGPQHRAYLHGAHGGMNGYWDLSRGPRTRNNCVDCHDPHAPAFPSMIPTFKPADRFLDPEAAHD